MTFTGCGPFLSLIAQFRTSPHGRWVLIGFLISCTALLVLSYLTYFVPSLTWRWSRSDGVPVKDYIAQSGVFVLCAFGLLIAAIEKKKEGRVRLAVALLILAFGFLANVTYIATGRTAVVVIIVLLVWVSFKHSNWRYGSLGIPRRMRAARNSLDDLSVPPITASDVVERGSILSSNRTHQCLGRGPLGILAPLDCYHRRGPMARPWYRFNQNSV
jgi:hypothetical protein